MDDTLSILNLAYNCWVMDSSINIVFFLFAIYLSLALTASPPGEPWTPEETEIMLEKVMGIFRSKNKKDLSIIEITNGRPSKTKVCLSIPDSVPFDILDKKLMRKNSKLKE